MKKTDEHLETAGRMELKLGVPQQLLAWGPSREPHLPLPLRCCTILGRFLASASSSHVLTVRDGDPSQDSFTGQMTQSPQHRVYGAE